VQAEWWTEFFSGLWLDVQRRAMSEESTRAEADFIEKLLQLQPGLRVLDVPCGNGRLSIELAARGCHVTGVDITRPLLEDAQRKATERGLALTLDQRDMRDLPWEAEFDAAFCFWWSFGYFDDENNAAFLQAVSRTLKPGGRFLFDTHITETVLPGFQQRGWARVGEMLVLEERRYDHAQSRLDLEWTLVTDGKVMKNPSSFRVYTYRELCQLLHDAGFTDLAAYDKFSQAPFQLGARMLALVATKA
jgi:SAM-dependent methyltransferase